MEDRNWLQLQELLEPIHVRAAALARRLCRSSADGDDLLQEALLRAWQKLSSLRDPGSFRPWFYAVLISVHRNRARASFWRRFVPLQRNGSEPEHDPAGEDGLLWEERRMRAHRLSNALSRLPAVQREAVVLADLEGYPIDVIAGLQQVSASAVKSRLSRGRERLRRHYQRLGLAPRGEPFPLLPEGEPS